MKKSDKVDGLKRGYYGVDRQDEEFLKADFDKEMFGDLRKTVGQHARVGDFDGGSQ
jgi:hypothetical protein